MLISVLIVTAVHVGDGVCCVLAGQGELICSHGTSDFYFVDHDLLVVIILPSLLPRDYLSLIISCLLPLPLIYTPSSFSFPSLWPWIPYVKIFMGWSKLQAWTNKEWKEIKGKQLYKTECYKGTKMKIQGVERWKLQ